MNKKCVLTICLLVVLVMQVLLYPVGAAGNQSAYIFVSSPDGPNYRYTNQSLIEQKLQIISYDAIFSYAQNATTMYNAIRTNEIVIIDPVSSGAGYVKTRNASWTNSFLCGSSNNEILTKPTSLPHVNSAYIYEESTVSPKVNLVTVFLGSNTAVYPDAVEDPSQITGEAYPANLLNAAYAKLTKCAIGWQDYITEDLTDEWVECFVHNIRVNTIADSMSNTTGYIFNTFGTSYAQGYVQYFCRGDATQIIGQ